MVPDVKEELKQLLPIMVKEEIVKYFQDRDEQYKQAFENIKDLFFADFVSMNDKMKKFRKESSGLIEEQREELQKVVDEIVERLDDYLKKSEKVARAFRIIFNMSED